jgi:hypothetical protein
MEIWLIFSMHGKINEETVNIGEREYLGGEDNGRSES